MQRTLSLADPHAHRPIISPASNSKSDPALLLQIADFLYVVRGFTSHVEAPCAMLQTGQVQIHTRPPAGLKPRTEAIRELEVPLPRILSWSEISFLTARFAWSCHAESHQ